jgi:DNA-binding response OmpR family regulator
MGEEKIILALPDNKDRNAINAALRQSGYSVIQKRSGQDILDSVVEDIPEIILMHADLPKVDGWQVCQKLKEDQLLQKIGIILFCNGAHESDIIRGFELGADEVFDANVSARELVARTQALSRRIS